MSLAGADNRITGGVIDIPSVVNRPGFFGDPVS